VSVAEPFELSLVMRAAILWDVPTLREGDTAAQNFLRAFEPRPENVDATPQGPLQLAAVVVRATAAGRYDEAQNAVDHLIASSTPAERLLGYLLRLWFGGVGEEREADLGHAHELSRRIADQEDRARVCRKIAVAAMDFGELERARTALEDGLAGAPHGSALQQSIRALLWDLGERSSLSLSDVLVDTSSDPLLAQPWVSDPAFDAITAADVERFRDGLHGIWGGTVRVGPTPLDTLNGLQRQADWAAAAGLRDLLIRVLCAHLLDGAARSDAQIRWAASSWVLARGDRITSVLARAERALDAEMASVLLQAVARNPLRLPMLPHVAIALWRHVGDEDIPALLGGLDPGLPGDVTKRESRQVWANLLWRAPHVWYREWQMLNPPSRPAALEELHPSAVDELTAAAQADLLRSCDTVDLPLREVFAGIAIALAISQDASPDQWLAIAGPDTIRDVADWRQDAVSYDVISEAVRTAMAHVAGAREQALAGQIGLEAVDPRVLLGDLAARLGHPNEEAEGLLVSIAADPRLPADHQLGALQGLVLLRHAGLLSEHARSDIRSLSDQAGPSMWGVIDTSVLRAARLWSVADELTDSELLELEAGCRSAQRQVRLVAVAAVADALRSGARSSAAWTLVSALYDPDDEVLSRALAEVRRGTLDAEPEALTVSLAALVSAYRTGRNTVRRAAIAAAWQLRDRPEASRLVDSATRDRSWEVRYAATGR